MWIGEKLIAILSNRSTIIQELINVIVILVTSLSMNMFMTLDATIGHIQALPIFLRLFLFQIVLMNLLYPIDIEQLNQFILTILHEFHIRDYLIYLLIQAI